MKRIHIHIGVDKLSDSIQFYSKLFGAQPTKQQTDYAQWILEDPQVNFAISTRSGKVGLDHLGIQVESALELEGLRKRLSAQELSTYNEGEVTCCYAKSDKSWVNDPNGLAWEAYQTMAQAQIYAHTNEIHGACGC